ncbi:MAG: dihydroorotate dehydrogenase electron transfer subunit [Candidatus Omnitrophica bacterium]|nr:dihydroorotate dehydrogenase electron transfer subunit [Candidatus Omnitrophota bacterium]
MKPVQLTARVISNRRIAGPYFKLCLREASIARRALPGQFVMLQVKREDAPFLRRPFSIHSAQGPDLEILYETKGAGTRILSKQKPRDAVELIGPLGNGFSLRLGSRRPIIVAGGIGVAPLVFLAQKLSNRKGLALIGGRTAAGVLCEKEFQKTGFSVTIATDDGSRGFHGRVTGLLERELRTANPDRQIIYACGPEPMIRRICGISLKDKVPAQVSLEAHMACGIGACLGCAMNTKHGYKRVCKEGPVFDIEELL